MSAHMRRLHTSDPVKVTVHGGDSNAKFIISRSSSLKLLNYLESLQSHDEDDDLIPADEVFRSIDQKYGKVGTTIRGFRVRDDLTQKDLAKKLKIHQVHVSQIENGRRVVGKNLAKKLAKLFHTDYRLFL